MPLRTRPKPVTLDSLDASTVVLIRLAAEIAAGSERAVRDAFVAARDAAVPPVWIEELVLQCYLFSGFPRALNAAREWRRVFPSDVANAGNDLESTTEDATDEGQVQEWRIRGEATCAAVYDGMYEKLRLNVRDMHPALDEWMVVEGYGKVLGRPGLDLARRELCVVAACAASGQARQLHSHLHGALNVGVGAGALGDAIDALSSQLGAARGKSAKLLLARVVGK
ncbi:MAG: carboxymuconolactone decarboxylase family protein [Gemmatimonadales bacterium]